MFEQDEDTFIVVDCGGGTVDLISYKLIQAKPMIVKECVKGSGKHQQPFIAYHTGIPRC